MGFGLALIAPICYYDQGYDLSAISDIAHIFPDVKSGNIVKCSIQGYHWTELRRYWGRAIYPACPTSRLECFISFIWDQTWDMLGVEYSSHYPYGPFGHCGTSLLACLTWLLSERRWLTAHPGTSSFFSESACQSSHTGLTWHLPVHGRAITKFWVPTLMPRQSRVRGRCSTWKLLNFGVLGKYL
jgi:hypothetical protein